jgi:hypothetical protein
LSSSNSSKSSSHGRISAKSIQLSNYQIRDEQRAKEAIKRSRETNLDSSMSSTASPDSKLKKDEGREDLNKMNESGENIDDDSNN